MKRNKKSLQKVMSVRNKQKEWEGKKKKEGKKRSTRWKERVDEWMKKICNLKIITMFVSSWVKCMDFIVEDLSHSKRSQTHKQTMSKQTNKHTQQQQPKKKKKKGREEFIKQ